MTELLLPSAPPKHISFSQATNLLGCGEQYRLERLYHVPQPPSWALVGGKAFHVCTEYFDHAFEDFQAAGPPATDPDVTMTPRGEDTSDEELHNLAREAVTTAIELGDGVPESAFEALGLRVLEQHIAKELDSVDAEVYPVETWKASGRKSVAWPDKANGDWWRHHIPIFLKGWAVWRMTSGYRMAYLPAGDGQLKPAIELDVSGSLGGIHIVAYLDRVFLHPGTGEPVVVDLKTSLKESPDMSQLALYSVLLGINGFPAPAKGIYWMAREGQHGKLHNLESRGRDYFEWKFGILKGLRDRGELVPNRSFQYCGTCSVKDYCHEVNGSQAYLVPKPWEKKNNSK